MRVMPDLVVVCMLWSVQLDGRYPDNELDSSLDYWIGKLGPVIRAEGQKETIVAFCNWCGTDDKVCYTGSSVVIGIKQGHVILYGALDRGRKELLVADTKSPIGYLTTSKVRLARPRITVPSETQPISNDPITLLDDSPMVDRLNPHIPRPLSPKKCDKRSTSVTDVARGRRMGHKAIRRRCHSASSVREIM
jgi:hypothetical protein